MTENPKITYEEFYKQAFIPILVNDGLDAKIQIEACVKAGFKVVEYTQRRTDLKEMVQWIRKTYPDLHIMIGSTIDNDYIVRSQQRHFPQLLTLEELAALNVHGFISMLKYSSATIQRYKNTHLLIPCASTVNEAYDLVASGAHFVKVTGPDLALVRRICSEPLFRFCPLFITGGMNLETIPLAIESGAMVIATGFDVMLKGQKNMTVASISAILKKYQASVISARSALYPEMAAALNDGDTDLWLEKVPHCVPRRNLHE